MKRIVMTTAAFAVMAPPALADDVTIPIATGSDDSYMRSYGTELLPIYDWADICYGTWGSKQVSNTFTINPAGVWFHNDEFYFYEVFLRFIFSSIPTGSTIDAVTLNVWLLNKQSAAGSMQVCFIHGDIWPITTAAWKPTSSLIYSRAYSSMTNGRWVSFPLLADSVQVRFDAGNPTLPICFASVQEQWCSPIPSGLQYSRWNMFESGVIPYLFVSYTPPELPGGAFRAKVSSGSPAARLGASGMITGGKQ
jgi:hypothetical protein